MINKAAADREGRDRDSKGEETTGKAAAMGAGAEGVITTAADASFLFSLGQSRCFESLFLVVKFLISPYERDHPFASFIILSEFVFEFSSFVIFPVDFAPRSTLLRRECFDSTVRH